MELKAILKNELKALKHCQKVLEGTKFLFWKQEFKQEVVDLTDPANADLIGRIELRKKISELNKSINSNLVERLKRTENDIEPYMRKYWDDINSGFGNTKNQYTNKNSFNNTFLYNKQSPLYRKFPDCLTYSSMVNYIIYLKHYLAELKQFGHNQAIKNTLEYFKDNHSMKDYYQEPALPDNWKELYKQIKFLKDRDNYDDEKGL